MEDEICWFPSMSQQILFGKQMLSKKAVEEYRQICKEEQGRELTYAEAQDEALKMLQMFKVIYRPIPKEVLKKYEQQK